MTKRVYNRTAAHCAAVFAITAGTAILSPAMADDTTPVGRGAGIYAQNCRACHGPNMMNSGTVTPDLRAFPDDKPRFVTTVKEGKNGKMPPWADILNEEQLEDLWAYISSKRKS